MHLNLISQIIKQIIYFLYLSVIWEDEENITKMNALSPAHIQPSFLEVSIHFITIFKALKFHNLPIQNCVSSNKV